MIGTTLKSPDLMHETEEIGLLSELYPKKVMDRVVQLELRDDDSKGDVLVEAPLDDELDLTSSFKHLFS